MALKHGDEYYTMFTHSENGKVLNRRLHRIEVQSRNGRMFPITGQDLPERISTYAGQDHKGEHLGQILLSPNKVPRRPYVRIEKRPWPSFRDVLNFAIGFFAVALIRFFVSVLGG